MATTYPTLTQEHWSSKDPITGERILHLMATEDNYNGSPVMLNQPYLLSDMWNLVENDIIVDRISVYHDATTSGKLTQEFYPVLYAKMGAGYPLKSKFTSYLIDKLEWKDIGFPLYPIYAKEATNINWLGWLGVYSPDMVSTDDIVIYVRLVIR